jgi:hypothetical protein
MGRAEYGVVQLRFPSSADQEAFKEEFGSAFDDSWTVEGLPGVIVTVEADDVGPAVSEAYPHAKTLVDSFSLVEPILEADLWFAPEPVVRILPTVLMMEPGQPAETVQYHTEGIARIRHLEKDLDIDRLNAQCLLPLLDRFATFLSDDALGRTETATRLKRFLRWYASSRAATSMAEKFIASWLALETLAGCEEDRGQKGPRLKSRLKKLVGLHMPAASLDSTIDRLWDLRCEIFHEAAIGRWGDDPRSMSVFAADISITRFLALVCAEFLVHATRPSTALFRTWATVNTYHSSIRLDFGEFPKLLHTVEFIARKVADEPTQGSASQTSP